jgi:hypothetical protein
MEKSEEILCHYCGIRIAESTTNPESCQICEDRAILDGVASGLDEEVEAIEREGADTEHVAQIMAQAADVIRTVAERREL